MDTQEYKRTLAGSVGAGMGAIFNGSGRTYYILEHKTESQYHHVGESQKIIVDQIEMGRDSSCQVRFDEGCETVSRKHAAIVRDGEGWKIVPLSQTNATFVNGQRITEDTKLNSGDEIKLSSHGPVMGFIVPQGKASLVSSIGMTERLSLFRQQALRPYKAALWIISIIGLLLIAGLVAWNLYENQKHKVEMTEQNAKIEQLQNDLVDAQEYEETLKEQANTAQERLDSAMSTIQDLSTASQKQKDEIEDMKKAASDASNKAAAASRKVRQLTQDLEKAKEEVPETIVEPNKDKDTGAISSLSDCYNAVYYIKMNDVVVYGADNREIVRFNTEGKIGGTGFILEDGRFVTARRVVEPWFYYRGGYIGYDKKKNRWTYDDLQWCANNGCKVVASCTAYAPNGSTFQFRNTDFKYFPLKSATSSILESYQIEVVDYEPARFVRKSVTKSSVKTLYWYTLDFRHDWATMSKRDQLGSTKGLTFSNSWSSNPEANKEISVIGYPLKSGGNSQSANPIMEKNQTNVAGLNINDVIELASRRWVEGYDGAPAIVEIDGKPVVIGILSHADLVQRDIITPIANTSK